MADSNPITAEPSAADPNSGDPNDPVRWRILAVLLIAIFMSLMSVSIVNVALPSIQTGLDATQSDLQWVLSGYALTFGIFLVAAGRAGDLMGRGGIFILGVLIFTASSVAAGLAPNAEALNAARFAQGLGSGLLNPQGVGMIQQYFRGSDRGRAFGYFGSVVGVAVGIGPVIGGLLIGAGGPDLGWRLTFLVNVPIGIICIALALRWFPRPLIRRMPKASAVGPESVGPESVGPESVGPESVGQGSSGPRPSLDPVGAILLGLAVLAVLFPFMESGRSPLIWLLIPLGLALVWTWVRWERWYAGRGRSPMVDLGIFSIRSFTNGSVIVTLYFLGMTSIWVLVALYIQDGVGGSALAAGAVGVPSALISAVAANWAGKRVMRYGRKIVIVGLLFALAGLGLSIAVVLLREAGHLSEWWLVLSLSLIGVAQGSVISPNQTLTLADVPLAYAGSSGAIMQTGQRIGTSIGIAVITAAVFGMLDVTSWAVAVAVGFGIVSVVVMLALAVAVKDQRDRGPLRQQRVENGT
ncbi:MFS transporter [Tomitella biformata]|uniref:MFS transporter n=1 Tax=Tomitella biformata TaxID=630403 RepID=UPI000462EBF0|nr:MFS transporter [Tomitella biformata]